MSTDTVSSLPALPRSACAWCERERGATPNPSDTHGVCERHMREQFARHGFAPEKVEALILKLRSLNPATPSALAGDSIAAADVSKFNGAASLNAPSFSAT